MTTQVQLRRGTTSQHSTFTGAIGEVTVDTDLNTMRVHDGSTAGGIRIAKFSEITSSFAFTVSADDSAGVPVTADGTGTLRITGSNSITTSSDSAGTVVITLDKAIDVDTISSTDSTSVTVNDGLIITGNLSFDGGVAVSTILDEDAMGSNSATALATQQSIKAYVDAEVGAHDTLNFSDSSSNAGSVLLETNDLEFRSGNSITATVAGTGVTFALNKSIDVNTISSSDSSAIQIADAVNVSGAVTSAGGFNGNATTATEATNVTVSANNTANESVFITFVDGATGTQGIETDTDLTYNPSTNVLSTTASAAQYADLAERYTTDAVYSEGHVMVIGGSAEITESSQQNDPKVAGVVSEKWAFLMNQHEDGPAIALKGKVQCKVVGSVNKGDALVTSSTPGHAVVSEDPNPICVIGRSLVNDADTHPRLITIKI